MDPVDKVAVVVGHAQRCKADLPFGGALVVEGYASDTAQVGNILDKGARHRGHEGLGLAAAWPSQQGAMPGLPRGGILLRICSKVG